MIDHLAVGPDTTSTNAWIFTLLLNAGKMCWAFSVDDALGAAEGRPASVPWQAGAGFMAVDNLAFGVRATWRRLTGYLWPNSSCDFV